MSNKWTFVKDRLPAEPVNDNSLEYLVTLSDGFVTSLYYEGDNQWQDYDGLDFSNVVAWMSMPESAIPPKKYRWRLCPDGYGALRKVYLIASGMVLTIGEWDYPVYANTFKNVFTNDEFTYLSNVWDFDDSLFVREEIPDQDKEAS